MANAEVNNAAATPDTPLISNLISPIGVRVMPLLDHFHSPLAEERHWQGLHSAWANAIVMRLNESILPVEYFAQPHIKLGKDAEVDVATHEDESAIGVEGNGGVATAVYAPPKPALAFPVNFAELDIFEIEIRQESGLKLAGAIELVSPANKDRPANRQAFVTKCAAYLQAGVGVMIVDVVTDRSANLHAELIEELAPSVTVDLYEEDALYAVAYRAQPSHQVEAWPERLQVGQTLPTLPLWLSDILAVPVDLEQTYVAACKALRIRVA
jgi:hypothetical protein